MGLRIKSALISAIYRFEIIETGFAAKLKWPFYFDIQEKCEAVQLREKGHDK